MKHTESESLHECNTLRMSHLSVSHYAYTRRVCAYNKPHSCVWHDSSICVSSWLIHINIYTDTHNKWVCLMLYIPIPTTNESVSWYRRQTHLLSVSKHETDSFVVSLMFFIKKKKVRLCHIWFWGVFPPHYGLPCLVANMKVSFAKEPCKRDYILQKRPMILSSLLIFSHSKYEGVFCGKRETRLIHICCEGRETVKGREEPPQKNGMSLISYFILLKMWDRLIYLHQDVRGLTFLTK